MKRYSKTILFLIVATLLGSLATAEERPASARKRIVQERMRNEIADIERRLATARNEHTAAARKYLASLTARKKLQLLRRSAEYHRDRCYWFDDECRRIYAMTAAYLDDEVAVLEERMAPEREEAIRAANDHATLSRRCDLIRNAELPEEETLPLYEIPELRGLFRCVEAEGWNRHRGIFVEADTPFDLPFAAEVTAAAREGKAGFMIVSFRDARIVYSYVGEVCFSPGDAVPPYSELFERPAGNPVVPGTVLVTLLHKGFPVDPSFMCRH